MKILLIADYDDNTLSDQTDKALTAAVAIAENVVVDVLVMGDGCRAIADQAAFLPAIAKVLLAESPVYAGMLAESCSALIASLAKGYDYVMAPASATGKNIMPRVAAMLDVMQISDISGVVAADTFERPVYAGNAIQTVKSKDNKKVITVRSASFEAQPRMTKAVAIETVTPVGDNDLSQFVANRSSSHERPDLTSARVVVSGGRGIAAKENFALIEAVADKLGAAVGASRAAVDAGYAPNDWQVGQTGKVVAPELYIAVGISGAIQHLAGMKDSKIIVAINKDGDAPIFQIADYGLIGDLFTVMPELNDELAKLD